MFMKLITEAAAEVSKVDEQQPEQPSALPTEKDQGPML
jgi:hypothetical protein